MRSSTEKIYKELREELRGKYNPDVLLPTERELCERFFVGRSAVRTVLHQLEEDGLIRSRGFHGARQVSMPVKSLRKVLVFDNPREIIHQSNEHLGIFAGISSGIRENRGEIIPIFHEYDSLLEELCAKNSTEEYSGVIFIEVYDKWYPRLCKSGIPTIIANCESNANAVASRVNFRMTGRMAGQELLRRGYRRIAMIGRGAGYVNDELSAGLRGAMAEERIWLDDASVVPYNYYDDDAKKRIEVEEQLRKLLVSRDRPDAFFVFRYTRCQLLMRLAEKLNLKIPQDLGLLVYDTPILKGGDNPNISILQEPVEGLGRSAVELLAGWSSSGVKPESKILSPDFVDKGSLRRLPGR